jgi:hypothetical protein
LKLVLHRPTCPGLEKRPQGVARDEAQGLHGEEIVQQNQSKTENCFRVVVGT